MVLKFRFLKRKHRIFFFQNENPIYTFEKIFILLHTSFLNEMICRNKVSFNSTLRFKFVVVPTFF
ncbi:hypothetical protein LEP1GSC059_0217 [Leptospira noguchii serovar Panama str. CZ214]|uniref:Uncharacterized protein n=1 Tax=Leptospira noguchii serovar Panama str. CZ214 TaxID=1001595 RepID=T0FUX3_9LEPT|nr:hypothetical protein LEP1GSC059_0217 [Leptospira noguchii serovar Panama str. CZ214]